MSRGALFLALTGLMVAGRSLAWAQTGEPSMPPPPAPPAGYEDKEPLIPSDLARKNERGYVTGLPLANFDPNTGFGFGVRGYYYFNGQRTDRRFAYTPYLHRVFAQVFATTGGLQFHWLDYDAPAFLETPFRLRAQLIYARNTASHFYGLGEAAAGELTFTGAGGSFSSFADYQSQLEQVRPDGTALTRYDEYDIIRPIGLLGLERTFLRGLVRTLVGLGVTHATIRDYTGDEVEATDATGETVTAIMGTSRLAEQCAIDALVGCDGGLETFFRFGISLDSRDFEPDPNSGVFVDAALDVGTGVVTEYPYLRFLIAARGYYSPIPAWADLVLAGRAMFEWQSQGTPFFALDTIPFTEDPRNGLGGIRTMRGFKQNRFLGNAYTLLNLEARWTFYRFVLLRQKFALIVAPFVDVGRAFDRGRDVDLSGWRRGQGAALRISWNLATIVTVDYGFSDEDAGLYINFSHIF